MGVARIFLGGGDLFSKKFQKNSKNFVKEFCKNFQKITKKYHKKIAKMDF